MGRKKVLDGALKTLKTSSVDDLYVQCRQRQYRAEGTWCTRAYPETAPGSACATDDSADAAAGAQPGRPASRVRSVAYCPTWSSATPAAVTPCPVIQIVGIVITGKGVHRPRERLPYAGGLLVA